MPRRKNGFIDRAQASTYQLVHEPTQGKESEKVLLPVNVTTAEPVPDGVVNNSSRHALNLGQASSSPTSGENFQKQTYELGEFGFPDDGYDYSKHFRTIGGGGGVFMDAGTGMPNPEAVSSSAVSRGGSDAKSRMRKDEIAMKESVVKEPEKGNGGEHPWMSAEDVQSKMQAMEEIQRDRKRDKDLDELFAALDEDGLLEVPAIQHEENVGVQNSNIASGYVDNDGLLDSLDDDFVRLASEQPTVEDNQPVNLEGIIEKYREPRLLDEQFENFMRGYELDSDDEDEDYETDLLNKVIQSDDYQPHVTSEEFEQLFGDNGLMDGIEGLKIKVSHDDDAEPKNDDTTHSDPMVPSSERVQEFSTYTAAEFERGMEGLLQSYNRVSGEKVLEAFDGIDVAREAILRAGEEEKARIDMQNELGLDESDGHDSELDSKFDEMFKEPDEKWDCETIISTYTNLDNHPSVIDAPVSHKRRSVKTQPIIRLDPKTQAPADFMPNASAPASSSIAMDFGSRREVVHSSAGRNKDESKEEKKARKAAVKEVARERRALKSEMRKAFGAEHVKQDRHATALGTSKVSIQF